MKPFRGIARIGVVLIFLVTLSLALTACEPGIEIRVQNKTHETLKIFFDSETFVGDAPAGGEVSFITAAMFPRYAIAVKDMRGNIVYTANFTRDDIRGKKTYRVIIPPKPE